MRAKKIFFLDYQKKDSLIINDDIYIGERIRDIIRVKNKNKYLMVLETSPAIGVIEF